MGYKSLRRAEKSLHEGKEHLAVLLKAELMDIYGKRIKAAKETFWGGAGKGRFRKEKAAELGFSVEDPDTDIITHISRTGLHAGDCCFPLSSSNIDLMFKVLKRAEKEGV